MAIQREQGLLEEVAWGGYLLPESENIHSWLGAEAKGDLSKQTGLTWGLYWLPVHPLLTLGQRPHFSDAPWQQWEGLHCPVGSQQLDSRLPPDPGDAHTVLGPAACSW